MKIGSNTTAGLNFGYGEEAFLKTEERKKEEVPQFSGVTEAKETEEKEKIDFAFLCKKFPEISFIVVDGTGEPQQEYVGICDTSVFGDLEQISIEIEKDVIDNLEEDYDNITMVIQWIVDNYRMIQGNAKASGCSYASVTLHYVQGRELSFWQTLSFAPPTFLRELGQHTNMYSGWAEEGREKHLQAFLRKTQEEIFDQLFEIGKEEKEEREQKHQSLEKYAKKYQESFIYE